MHGIGLVHCDLKPENLMLSSQNSSDAVIKIVDFGCARVTHGDMADVFDKAGPQDAGGGRTPAYTPPDYLRMKRSKKKQHNRIDPSFDTWSLGVILYIMLTVRRFCFGLF
jgi:protein kinase D